VLPRVACGWAWNLGPICKTCWVGCRRRRPGWRNRSRIAGRRLRPARAPHPAGPRRARPSSHRPNPLPETSRIDPLPRPTTIGQSLAASPRQFRGWPNGHECSKKGGALGNQPRRPAIVANRRARPSYDLSSSTGDNVWASRARSQRPSECLRYTVIRWPACCVASPPARGVTDNASRLRV
jgi:hypothetical protein